MNGSAQMRLSGGGIGRRLRYVRWNLRRAYAATRYGQAALAGAPILFGNSFPKSGTHLLAQALLAFPKIGLAVDRGMGPILTFDRFTGQRRATKEILSGLKSLRQGDIGFGHINAEPEILEQWCRSFIANFFMYRDPRDVVVSHAFYIAEKATQNVHHAYYKALPTLNDRIKASILGRPDFDPSFPNINARFEPYMGWLDCQWVCPLRFEDFITDQQNSLAKMLDYAIARGFQLHRSREKALAILTEVIRPGRSFTYRRGQIGDWRNHFTAEHKQLFKDTAGQLLVELGYEKDLDW